MLFPASVFAIALAFIAPRVGAQTNGGLTVHTAEGDVVGTLVSPTVRQFLGIPYAVGNRWEPPTNAPARSIPFNASSFGDSCPQSIPASIAMLVPSATNISQSEDCLNLNIWTPTKERKQQTAVMIWIYGGAFQFGTVCSGKV
jgi:carboxylesterase type B